VARFAALAGIPERTYHRRRGLLLPWGFRADRKSWAALPRKVFHDPPTERDRVWQTDFSEFETAGGGTWRICYEHLYRAPIDDGGARAMETARFRDIYNYIRRPSAPWTWSTAWQLRGVDSREVGRVQALANAR
jgi:hypothetical protein